MKICRLKCDIFNRWLILGSLCLMMKSFKMQNITNTNPFHSQKKNYPNYFFYNFILNGWVWLCFTHSVRIGALDHKQMDRDVIQSIARDSPIILLKRTKKGNFTMQCTEIWKVLLFKKRPTPIAWGSTISYLNSPFVSGPQFLPCLAITPHRLLSYTAAAAFLLNELNTKWVPNKEDSQI